jgi:hypothetical protein
MHQPSWASAMALLGGAAGVALLAAVVAAAEAPQRRLDARGAAARAGLLLHAADGASTEGRVAEQTAAAAVGAVEHVSLAWIEGWSCDPAELARNISVEFYVDGVSGDGHCIQHGVARLCRCGSAVAQHLREQAVAAQCGGTAWKGYHAPTPAALLDGVRRDVYVFTSAPDGGALLGSFSFDSDILYSQEKLGAGSIDFHLLVNEVFGMGEIPPAEASLYGSDHTVFVYWPPKTNTTAVNPTSGDFSLSTGIAAASPRATSQRQVGNAGCYNHGGTTRCNSVTIGSDESSVGFVVDTRALGYYSGFVGMQHGWSKPPRPWAAAGTRLRVSATVTQPLVFEDAVTTSPDNIAYWYYVLFLNDRSQPKTRTRGIWLTQQAWQSRSSGLGISDCTLCSPRCVAGGGRCNNGTKKCEYPCANQTEWCPAKPDLSCFQYRLERPMEPAAWVDTTTAAVTSYLLRNLPLTLAAYASHVHVLHCSSHVHALKFITRHTCMYCVAQVPASAVVVQQLSPFALWKRELF